MVQFLDKAWQKPWQESWSPHLSAPPFCFSLVLRKWRLKHFYWHRIVADEFHELIGAAVDSEHPFNEAKHQLTQLESHSRWGLILGIFMQFYDFCRKNYGRTWDGWVRIWTFYKLNWTVIFVYVYCSKIDRWFPDGIRWHLNFFIFYTAGRFFLGEWVLSCFVPTLSAKDQHATISNDGRDCRDGHLFPPQDRADQRWVCSIHCGNGAAEQECDLTCWLVELVELVCGFNRVSLILFGTFWD